MNRKQKIIVSITGIILVSLILIGLTYAYFLTKITGNTNSKSISVTTANLELVYGDGNGILAPTDKLMPGDTVGTKEFTVTNNGNNKVEGYLVIFRDVTNTLLRPEDLVYKVECKQYLNDVETGTCDGVEYETQLPTGTGSGSGVIVSNDIDAGYVQKYSLTLKYLEPNVDQSEDMGKNIEAKIDIMDVKMLNSENGITNYASNTLAGTIINNAINKRNGTELVGKTAVKLAEHSDTYEKNYIFYSETTESEYTPDLDAIYTYSSTYENTEDGYIILTNTKTGKYSDIYEDLVENYILCGEGDSTGYCKNDVASKITDIEKVTSASDTSLTTDMYIGYRKNTMPNELSVISDNDGISYYYRGRVENNYINFDDRCWRIIRIEGDGSIKLILDDDKNTCDSVSYDNSSQNAYIVPNGARYSSRIEYGNSSNSNNLVNNFINGEISSTGEYYSKIYVLPLLKKYLNGGRYEYESINKIMNLEYNGLSSENLSKLKEDKYYINNFDNKIFYDTDNYIYEVEDRIVNNRTPLLSYGSKVVTYQSKIGLISWDEAVLSGFAMIDKVSANHMRGMFGWGSKTCTYLENDYAETYTTSIFMSGLANRDYIYYLRDGANQLKNINIRPTITLKSNINIASGNGTKENPYEVD